MNYIILDLEWNQPFSYKHMIRSPLPLYGEIIQIGAVKLDENYHILDTFKILVSPKFYRKIHKDVLKITNITSDDLQYGFGFEIAFKHFKKWCGEDFTFLIWGDSDIDVLKSNLRLYNLDIEWIPPTYNLQIVFDKQRAKGILKTFYTNSGSNTFPCYCLWSDMVICSNLAKNTFLQNFVFVTYKRIKTAICFAVFLMKKLQNTSILVIFHFFLK